MKRLQFILVLMLSSSLIFSGCSSKQATYRGQTKDEWKHVYVELENAKKQRDVTIRQRDKLQRKCINKTENTRISAGFACTTQLKELNEQIKYFDEVIISRSKIVENLDADQRRIDKQEAEEARRTSAKVWSGIKTTLSVALVIGVIAWLANADKEDENSAKFSF